MAAYEDNGALRLFEATRIADNGDADWTSITREQLAEQRDQLAGERDREADARDRQADDRDRQAETADRQVPAEVIDLRERRSLTLLRHQAAAERQQAALDRAAAAADRRSAGQDRRAGMQERSEANTERQILQHDELTGLLQRGAGLIALEREIARSDRSGDGFVIVFIDVDGLKLINDEYGHGSGDRALRTVGETLRARLRSYDLALRYGGDEFVCILPGFGVAEAEARLAALQAELTSGPDPVPITFGVAEWRAGEGTESLLARADAALYDIRRKARGTEQSREATAQDDGASAVLAHTLLNSSAVVSMGITTLEAHWDALLGTERLHLLQRMLTHASLIDVRLKELTRGR